MEQKRRLSGYYNYTVVLTYMGMLFGFTGILFVMEGTLRKAVVCLMLSGLCDMFDGAVAATKERDDREKRFGIQIDSLSDLICFGVLPGLLAYWISGKTYPAFLCACLYVLCALIRLAWFNVCEEERQQQETKARSCYTGLPVTSAALIIPAVFVLQRGFHIHSGIVILCSLVGMAAAFVLPFRIRKPYLPGKIGLLLAGGVELVILIVGVGLDL